MKVEEGNREAFGMMRMETDERSGKIVKVQTQEAEDKRHKKRVPPKKKSLAHYFSCYVVKKSCHGKKENALARS